MKPTEPDDPDLAFQQMAAMQLAQGASVTFQAAAQAAATRRAAEAKRGAARGLRGPARPIPTAQVVLLRDSRGLLRWDYRAPASAGVSAAAPGLRRAGALSGRYRSMPLVGATLASAEVAEVGPNEITAALQRLDLKLTPQQGLRPLVGSTLGPAALKPGALADCTRLLLLVHGTFSQGEMYTEELGGSGFLKDARQRYSHILAFDHPTLSVSPILNAMDLEQALLRSGLPVSTPIDLLCHSRGGLVATWWARATRFKPTRLVAVGAPINGTSLASPYRIRYFLDYLANLSSVLSKGLKAGAMFPSFASGFLAGASGLVGIVGGAFSALSSLPLADAGVALVPGVHGLSRVTNNAELSRLREEPPPGSRMHGVEYCVISSNFEVTRDAPWWHVVTQLRQMPWRAADGVADKLFPGGNDLVVDTDTMSGQWPVAARLDYAGSDSVHHCAYFREARTVEALRSWLKV